MKVLRAGRSTAPRHDWTATSVYSSQTSRSPASDWTAKPADTSARPPLVTRTSLRRSVASMTEPPSSPTIRVGTTWATPMAPTASGDRVRL